MRSRGDMRASRCRHLRLLKDKGAGHSDTMGALARRDLLPGHGSESGTLIGTTEPPRMMQGFDDLFFQRSDKSDIDSGV